MAPLSILHVIGSPTSAFYDALSVLYARDAVRPAGTSHWVARVHPNGRWQQGPDLATLGAPMALPALLVHLPATDLTISHLLCPAGLTAYRGLFEEVLGRRLVGSSAAGMQAAQDKIVTRLLAEQAGVAVASAQVLDAGGPPDAVTLPLPVIVKPACADNSDGVQLVRRRDALSGALAAAGALDNRILVEQFIPGREMRVGVIARNGRLDVLPILEYAVTDTHPIRTTADKLDVAADGQPTAQSRSGPRAGCPADVDAGLAQRLGEAARRSFQALGARHYGLFDFRVHRDTGQVVLLEAGLFWSFGPPSLLSQMLAAAGESLPEVAASCWRQWAGAAPQTHDPIDLLMENAS